MALTLDGEAPQTKGQKKEIISGDIKTVFSAVAVGDGYQVVSHWRLDSVVHIPTGITLDTTQEFRRQRSNEGPWHSHTKEWLSSFLEAETEVPVIGEDLGDRLRIADIKLGNIVIELQNSSMTFNEFKARNEDYVQRGCTPAWILSENRYKVNTKRDEYAIQPTTFKPKHGSVCTISYSSTSPLMQPDYLELENIPVFLDLEDEEHFLQLIHVQVNTRARSYRWTHLFKTVHKDKLLEAINTPNIYENERNLIVKKVLNVDVLDNLDEILKKANDLKTLAQKKEESKRLQENLSQVQTQAQLEAAVKYLRKQGDFDESLTNILTNEGLEEYLRSIRVLYDECLSLQRQLENIISYSLLKEGVPAWFKPLIAKDLEPIERELNSCSSSISNTMNKLQSEIVFFDRKPELVPLISSHRVQALKDTLFSYR